MSTLVRVEHRLPYLRMMVCKVVLECCHSVCLKITFVNMRIVLLLLMSHFCFDHTNAIFDAVIPVTLNITQYFVNEGAKLTDLCVRVLDPGRIPSDGFVRYYLTITPGTATGIYMYQGYYIPSCIIYRNCYGFCIPPYIRKSSSYYTSLSSHLTLQH